MPGLYGTFPSSVTYPSTVTWPGDWHLLPDPFDTPSPDLAAFDIASALATLETAAAFAVFAITTSFVTRSDSYYGLGNYGAGLYGEATYGQFDLSDAAIAAFLTDPALASYDVPEPAL